MSHEPKAAANPESGGPGIRGRGARTRLGGAFRTVRIRLAHVQIALLESDSNQAFFVLDYQP
jgi:hypothetical protein